MKKAVFSGLLLSLAVVGFADGNKNREFAVSGEGGYAGFVLSYMMPDFTELNRHLETNGLSGFSDEIVTFGGGFWTGYKHILMGYWGFGRENRADGDTVSAKLEYTGFFFEPGYFLNIYKGFGFIPSVGIGATKVKLHLRELLSDVDFDDVLLDPTRTSLARFRTFSVAPALAINIPIEFLNIQIKGGYMWSPVQGKWKLKDRAELREAPDINTSGLFASVGLLLGEF
ncbi:hypothetical protein JXM67_02760 [candidate division WOR-3 bacterium]|nr:hypothetical protein [candidate division WOR-3 bacterium]